MNHSTESCHKLINHVKAEQYFSKNPAIKKILTENPSSTLLRRTYLSHYMVYMATYIPTHSSNSTLQHCVYTTIEISNGTSKHVNKGEDDEVSVPEEETESDEEQEDEVSGNGDNGDIVHINEDEYIYDSDYDEF
eukprot:10305440-Ditylum_brightwellii.AAC.1